MDALILTRDEGEQLYSFEGKHVVPCASANNCGDYREWLVGVNHTQYCIICEGDTWTLMYYVPDIAGWCDAPDDVDTFLTTHLSSFLGAPARALRSQPQRLAGGERKVAEGNSLFFLA